MRWRTIWGGHLTLRYVECGKVRLTLEHAAKISSLYNYDLDELLDRA